MAKQTLPRTHQQLRLILEKAYEDGKAHGHAWARDNYAGELDSLNKQHTAALNIRRQTEHKQEEELSELRRRIRACSALAKALSEIT